MKVIIENTQVETRSGEKNGRAWTMHSQQCRIMSDYVRGVSQINIIDPTKPYPIGDYNLDLEKNFQLGRFGRMELLNNLKLEPVPIQGDSLLSKVSGFK